MAQQGPWKVLLLLQVMAIFPVAIAECWRRSDGVEICASDKTGWIAVWWFWFVLIVFAAIVAGYWESCGCRWFFWCCGRRAAGKKKDCDHLITVTVPVDEDAQTKLMEPLLVQPIRNNNNPSTKKPNYRYFD